MTTVYGEMKLRGGKTEGDIGLEIEVEGKRLPQVKSFWRMEHDGSLRGEENMEYVLQKPLTLDKVKEALSVLDKAYVDNKTVVDDTVRAGVHVHINCQSLTLTELINFIVLYVTMENVLVHFCGDTREGNLFCLRCSDAEFLPARIIEAIQFKKLKANFHDDNIRYSSMNLKALGDYGSLEFRAMRGTRDLDLIYEWAETLYNIRECAKGFNNPVQIIQNFSADGPALFLQKVLGDNYALITKGLKQKDIQTMMYDGMRIAQDIAYAIQDWEGWDKAKKKVVGGLEFDEDDPADEPEEDF